jgi:hypothetical protein
MAERGLEVMTLPIRQGSTALREGSDNQAAAAVDCCRHIYGPGPVRSERRVDLAYATFVRKTGCPREPCTCSIFFVLVPFPDYHLRPTSGR